MVSFDDRSLIANWCDFCRLLNVSVYLSLSRDLNDSLKHLDAIDIFDNWRKVGNDRLLKSL